MSRSIKKAGRLFRERVTALEKSLGLKKSGTTRGSRARRAGAAAACVAGIAAVVHYVRVRGRDVRARGRDASLHVRHDGARWALRTNGTNGSAKTFATKREAVSAARQEAAAAAPSALVIHRVDGSVERSHSYESD